MSHVTHKSQIPFPMTQTFCWKSMLVTAALGKAPSSMKGWVQGPLLKIQLDSIKYQLLSNCLLNLALELLWFHIGSQKCPSTHLILTVLWATTEWPRSDVWVTPLRPTQLQLGPLEVTAVPSADTVVGWKLQFYFEMIIKKKKSKWKQLNFGKVKQILLAKKLQPETKLWLALDVKSRENSEGRQILKFRGNTKEVTESSAINSMFWENDKKWYLERHWWRKGWRINYLGMACQEVPLILSQISLLSDAAGSGSYSKQVTPNNLNLSEIFGRLTVKWTPHCLEGPSWEWIGSQLRPLTPL